VYTYSHRIAALDQRYPDRILVRVNAACVAGLASVDFELLSLVTLPTLYASGVRYRKDRPGRERWKDAIALLRTGFGDCKDLVAWRIAELWRDGEQADIVSELERLPGELVFHVSIRRANGRIEDPSILLGM
jgi:hypothetical protein